MADRHDRRMPPPGDFSRRYRFNGGLKLDAHCDLSTTRPVRAAEIPSRLVLPLQQHIGATAECRVRVGDRVLKGEQIARPAGRVSAALHAPTSGTVLAIEDRPVPHPSGLPATCVILECDGDDRAVQAGEAVDYLAMEPAELCELISKAGIVGLGGAGFPTRVKLQPPRPIELLVINGAECEPCISCDEGLMQSQPEAVIAGTRILQHILRPSATVIALEDNMQDAARAMRGALDKAGDTGIELVEVESIYPTGGERQLIKVLTNREVPSQGIPADIGIVCQNVGTVAAVHRAVERAEPLLSRIVTITGDAIGEPCNIDALIGTPIRDLVRQAGGYSESVERLLIGGPMMGFAISTDDIPISKTTNCVLAVSATSMPAPQPALPCIRCGKCTDVCPAELLPQQLYWHARASNHDAAQEFGLFDCIECGCCAHVCPSHIPLVQYYRHEKSTIWAQESQKKASDFARQRHESRLARLERIKQERAARLAKKKQAVSKQDKNDAARKAAIQAALERVERKKAGSDYQPGNVDNLTDRQQARIDAVEARRRTRQDGEKH